jgi:hypothetical protein
MVTRRQLQAQHATTTRFLDEFASRLQLAGNEQSIHGMAVALESSIREEIWMLQQMLHQVNAAAHERLVALSPRYAAAEEAERRFTERMGPV